MKNKMASLVLVLGALLALPVAAQQLQWQMVILKKPELSVLPEHQVVYAKAEGAIASQLVSGEYEVADKALLNIDDNSADERIYQLTKNGVNLALRYQIDISTSKASVVKKWRFGLSAYLVDLESKKQIETAEVVKNYDDVPNNCDEHCFSQWLAERAAGLAQDLGAIFVEKLNHLPKRYRYELAFTGFLGEELEQVRQYLKDVDGYVFAHLQQKLESESQLFHQLEGARYEYLSNLPPDELDAALFVQLRTFGIPVKQAKSRGNRLEFSRSSMPYWWAYSLLLIFLLSIAYYVYRFTTLKKHNLQLDKLSHQRHSQQWLDYLKSGQMLGIPQPNIWHTQEKDVSAAIRQAKALSEQAWLLADQGDYVQAQLKVTEALQLNADDKDAQELKDNIVNYQRGHDRYSLAVKELNSHPEQAAKLLREAAELNPHLSEKIAKLTKQNANAMQQGEAASAVNQAQSAIDLKEYNKAYSLIDAHLVKYTMDVSSAEFLQLADLRKQLDQHSPTVIGAAVTTGVLSSYTFYPSLQLDLGRKVGDPQNSFAVGFKRNSRAGKQNAFVRKGRDFFVMDQASSNGSMYASASLNAGQLVKVQHEGLLCTGGAPNSGTAGMCQIKTLLAKNGSAALILRLNSNAFQFVDDTNIGVAWPTLDEDMVSRWVMLGDELHIGVDDKGKLDVGCIKGSDSVARLIYDNGYFIAPDVSQNEQSPILIGGQIVHGKVPITDNALISIAGQSFSMQGVQ